MTTQVQKTPGGWIKEQMVGPLVHIARRVITSDAFTAPSVDLSARVTDAELGGEPLPWVGVARAVYEVSGGVLRFSSTNTSTVNSALLLPMPSPDYEVSALVSALPVASSFVLNARRTAADLGAAGSYRATVEPIGRVRLTVIDSAGASTLLSGWVQFTAGQTVGIRCTGPRVSLVVDGVTVFSVVDGSLMGAGFAGLTSARPVAATASFAVSQMSFLDYS